MKMLFLLAISTNLDSGAPETGWYVAGLVILLAWKLRGTGNAPPEEGMRMPARRRSPSGRPSA